MRANEFVQESAESINTYLLLRGIDITKWEKITASVISQHESNPALKIALQSALFTINSKLAEFINDNALWSRFAADPEIDQIYDRFVALYNNNVEYLRSVK